ncbi:hypothetical protein DFR31_0551 [Alkalispirillum mobile]|uniref:Uncharacterized protein n=1 Tax=Alkalispirillum mobile TaxID=85925 RepID=A0A498C4H2_9GAMM|nr:hypothetical protein DFR31_0551 [Alkalispirillum mobile]
MSSSWRAAPFEAGFKVAGALKQGALTGIKDGNQNRSPGFYLSFALGAMSYGG